MNIFSMNWMLTRVIFICYNDIKQNSRFIRHCWSYLKVSAQVLSNFRSSSSGFSWTTGTHFSPGFLLSWFFDSRSFDPIPGLGFLSITSNTFDSGTKLYCAEIWFFIFWVFWIFLKNWFELSDVRAPFRLLQTFWYFLCFIPSSRLSVNPCVFFPPSQSGSDLSLFFSPCSTTLSPMATWSLGRTHRLKPPFELRSLPSSATSTHPTN